MNNDTEIYFSQFINNAELCNEYSLESLKYIYKNDKTISNVMKKIVFTKLDKNKENNIFICNLDWSLGYYDSCPMELDRLNECPNLISLKLTGQNIGNKLINLKYCQNLTKLNISYCSIIDLKTIYQYCKQIKELSLVETDIKQNDIESLNVFPNLKRLKISSDKIFLKNNIKLQTLNLLHCAVIHYPQNIPNLFPQLKVLRFEHIHIINKNKNKIEKEKEQMNLIFQTTIQTSAILKKACCYHIYDIDIYDDFNDPYIICPINEQDFFGRRIEIKENNINGGWNNIFIFLDNEKIFELDIGNEDFDSGFQIIMTAEERTKKRKWLFPWAFSEPWQIKEIICDLAKHYNEKKILTHEEIKALHNKYNKIIDHDEQFAEWEIEFCVKTCLQNSYNNIDNIEMKNRLVMIYNELYANIDDNEAEEINCDILTIKDIKDEIELNGQLVTLQEIHKQKIIQLLKELYPRWYMPNNSVSNLFEDFVKDFFPELNTDCRYHMLLDGQASNLKNNVRKEIAWQIVKGEMGDTGYFYNMYDKFAKNIDNHIEYPTAFYVREIFDGHIKIYTKHNGYLFPLTETFYRYDVLIKTHKHVLIKEDDLIIASPYIEMISGKYHCCSKK